MHPHLFLCPKSLPSSNKRSQQTLNEEVEGTPTLHPSSFYIYSTICHTFRHLFIVNNQLPKKLSLIKSKFNFQYKEKLLDNKCQQ